MHSRSLVATLLLASLANCRASDAQQATTIPRYRGKLDSTEARFNRGMNYDPGDVALAWTAVGNIIVAHIERYSYADVYSTTCEGSGIFAVPASGGAAQPLVVGAPLCDALMGEDGWAADAAGAWLIYSAEFPPNNSGLVRMNLRTRQIDTLASGCRVYLERPAMSRDGRRIAAIGLCKSRDQEHWAAYVLHFDGTGLREVAPAVDEAAPAWNADGSALVVAGKTGLVIADTSGHLQQLPVQGGLPAWSPDGQWIAFTTGATISVMRPSGADLREVFHNRERGTYRRGWGPSPEGLVLGSIVWSPDSRSLVFSRRFDRGISIWRLDVATSRLSPVTAADKR